MNFPKSFSELFDKYFPEEYLKEQAKKTKEEIAELNNFNVRKASEFVPLSDIIVCPKNNQERGDK